MLILMVLSRWKTTTIDDRLDGDNYIGDFNDAITMEEVKKNYIGDVNVDIEVVENNILVVIMMIAVTCKETRAPGTTSPNSSTTSSSISVPSTS